MKIRVPTEVEIVWLNDWTYYRGMEMRGCTLVQLETSWESGRWGLIVRLLGFGLRVTAERSERCRP